jgi:hypothetical protein
VKLKETVVGDGHYWRVAVNTVTSVDYVVCECGEYGVSACVCGVSACVCGVIE